MSIYIKLPHIFQIYRYILLDISLVGIIRYIQPQNHHDISQHIGIYRVFQDIFQYIADISRYIAIYCFYFWRYITKIYRYIVKNDNDISRYMSIYRDISWYIAIYRDISRDISIYLDISIKFAKYAVTNPIFDQNFWVVVCNEKG